MELVLEFVRFFFLQLIFLNDAMLLGKCHILIFLSSNRLTVLHSITCFQHDLDATKDHDSSFLNT